MPPPEAVPTHVAIIMDGNGRWAKQRGLSRQAGHRAGTENIRRIIETFAERGVRYLTLYAFSTENWGRPRREVSALIKLLGRVLERELRALHENGVRLVHIGSLEPLSPDLQKKVCDAIELTRGNTGLTVCLAFNYGGRAEIVEAVRRIVAEGIPASEISEDVVAAHLTTKGIPDPDLIIRTAGEMRLSNFLLWQAAYSEYYSTPVFWPDFGEAEIDRALDAFAARERRFGGVKAARPSPVLNGHTRR
ncbi:MAG TPA: polyprenyl diphosphate synthase [Dehalococcoidia bacterium]